MQPKKPAVDTAALVRQIDHHLERLKEAKDERIDIASDVFDDLWDVFTDKIVESYFDFISYPMAKGMGRLMLGELDEKYQEILCRKLQQNSPEPAQSLLKDLEKLGINPPSGEFTEDSNTSLVRYAKKHVELAIEKSKPGLFASDDPEKVGRRICDRLRGTRDQLRNDVIGCAQRSAGSWLTTQIDSWQRLRSLMA